LEQILKLLETKTFYAKHTSTDQASLFSWIKIVDKNCIYQDSHDLKYKGLMSS